MEMMKKIKIQIKKIQSKLGLKNKQIKKREQTAKIEVLADIPPLKITSFEAIRHFEQFGGCFNQTPKIDVLDDLKRKNFKNEGQEKQLKILYLYIVKMSDNGIYKKEGSAKIGEFFGVGKFLIQSRFKSLIDNGYIVELKQMNRFYKINKEWSA
jgi:hypothetical protein